jgi:predicted alpha/beta superfamily hydrolase
LRQRDFSFPLYPKFPLKPPPIEGVLVAEPGTPDYYGGANFQRFIGDELVPFIDANYNTIVGDRTFFGHSAGAAFGLATLFARPQLFSHYIISSPSVVYRGDAADPAVRYEREFLVEEARKFVASGRSLPGIRLYMSVGTEEEFEPELLPWQLTSGFYRMAAVLRDRGIPGLQITTEVLQGETHMTAWPLSFMHGIQAVFESGRYRQTATLDSRQTDRRH